MLDVPLDGELWSPMEVERTPLPRTQAEEGRVPPPVGAVFCLQVTLWKESVDGQWVCISDVNKGQGSVSTAVTEGQQNEQ